MNDGEVGLLVHDEQRASSGDASGQPHPGTVIEVHERGRIMWCFDMQIQVFPSRCAGSG